MRIIKPDSKNQESNFKISVFLAGSIEMGSAIDWQEHVSTELSEFDIVIYNPRRNKWDSTLEQRETNQEFRYQVNWEMNKMETSSIIFFNFLADTKSPVTMLELGKYSNRENVIVCCPENFWRKGNIEIVCSRCNIPLFTDLEKAISSLKSKILSLTN